MCGIAKVLSRSSASIPVRGCEGRVDRPHRPLEIGVLDADDDVELARALGDRYDGQPEIEFLDASTRGIVR